jgi:signal transduction histidine kinase
LVSAAGFCNGLGNMRRRMTDLGGRCLVDSKIGDGTTIQFLLYLDKNVK